MAATSGPGLRWHDWRGARACPNKEEIKAIRQLTNLTGFVSSGTLIASLERLETRLAEDAKIIAEKASKISGSSTASPESNQNNLGITVPPGFNIK